MRLSAWDGDVLLNPALQGSFPRGLFQLHMCMWDEEWDVSCSTPCQVVVVGSRQVIFQPFHSFSFFSFPFFQFWQAEEQRDERGLPKVPCQKAKRKREDEIHGMHDCLLAQAKNLAVHTIIAGMVHVCRLLFSKKEGKARADGEILSILSENHAQVRGCIMNCPKLPMRWNLGGWYIIVDRGEETRIEKPGRDDWIFEKSEKERAGVLWDGIFRWIDYGWLVVVVVVV